MFGTGSISDLSSQQQLTHQLTVVTALLTAAQSVPVVVFVETGNRNKLGRRFVNLALMEQEQCEGFKEVNEGSPITFNWFKKVTELKCN